jgi:hypothetical protein
MSLLEGFDFQKLEEDPSIIYCLSSDLKLVYYNPAWLNFIDKHEQEPCVSKKFPIGISIFSDIDEPLKSFYTETYLKIFNTQKIWDHNYECTDKSMFKIFHQTLYPLLNRKGLLIINNIVKRDDLTANRETLLQIEEIYTWPTGFITQCIHCKRVQRVDKPAIWDWVPEWVENTPLNNSSSLCSPCYDYYYNQLPMRKRYRRMEEGE